MSRAAYLSATGMICAIGGSTEMVCAAAKAGISRFGVTSYFTKDKQQVVQALVPDASLPPLNESVGKSGNLSFRDKRLLRMSHIAATEALNSYSGDAPIPLILSGPEVYPGVDTGLNSQFIGFLAQQSGLPLDVRNSRLVSVGRAGAMEAMKLAQHYLHDLDNEYVLIGGCDSYQHSPLLRLLDRMDRIAAQRAIATSGRDDFIPGEAAAFALLTRNPAATLMKSNAPVELLAPGFADEPGHWFSEEGYKGEALSQAFRGALEAAKGVSITSVYGTPNGESYWAKELGVAMIRNRQQLGEADLHHPAEFYGDAGAAAGLLQVGLAAHHALNVRGEGSLIYCSSDQGYRGAVVLTAKGQAA